ncbi:MAG: thiamine-phosphate kinase [Pirellulales bacterium]|nr:thiamine-phosphate kinase [Pirellulales bacterium]
MTLESELLAWLRENLSPNPRLAVGFGDDAAVLAGNTTAETVVTTDMLTEGVDFFLHEVDPRQIGHKALGVNLSDLAAMAARPVAVLVSLVLPRDGSNQLSALELAIELYHGLLPLAERFGTAIAGGDTNTWDGPLAISITALGETTQRGPLQRTGAQLGDQLLVTGRLGGSILGRHLQVEPRIEEALLLHERYPLHAAIDVSDGLALDVSRLAAASRCGALLDTEAIPVAQAAEQLSQRDGRTPLEHALGDGEDFELVLAVPQQAAEQMLAEQPLQISLTRIGEIIESPGLWQRNVAGERTALQPHGYEHRGNA